MLEFNALVLNDTDSNVANGSGVQGGSQLLNDFRLRLNASAVGGANTLLGTSTQNDFNNLTVVEPQINNLSKSIDLPLPLDAGDTFTYRLNFANNTAHPAQYAPAVRVATTAALSSGTYLPAGGSGGTGAFTSAPAAVDGATLADGDRALVKNQADAKQNGIYKVVDAANRVGIAPVTSIRMRKSPDSTAPLSAAGPPTAARPSSRRRQAWC